MKIVAYVSALILALFNAKLVAGAISGIVITPLAKPFERVVVVRKYIVPFFQGIFMGGVALYTARWFLDWVGVELMGRILANSRQIKIKKALPLIGEGFFWRFRVVVP